MKVVQPPDWPKPRGYSNGLLVSPGQAILFIAGQIGWNNQGQIVGEDFTAQFEQALTNLLTVAREAGGDASSIVKLTIFVTDTTVYNEAREALGEVYRRLMGRHYPAMTLVQVSALLEPGAKVEIEGVAAIRVGE